MTNRKTTKRALLSSVVALFLCFAMLLGTTYAWFTDSVTSANNIIKSGNLDVDLYRWDAANTSVEITNTSEPLFGNKSNKAQNDAADTLWEPGKTQVVYLSIKNNGTLDLKYQVNIDVTGVEKNLIDVLEYKITPDAKYGTVATWSGNGKQVKAGVNTDSIDITLKAGQEHFFALSVHMLESANNDYQDASATFNINVLATQLASESDSFNNQYDKDAN
jgi:predicted ribosomally synthesized peptide with SipW-like signal peptide